MMDVRLQGGSRENRKSLIMRSDDMTASDEEQALRELEEEGEVDEEEEEEEEEDLDDDDDDLPPGVIPTRYKHDPLSKAGLSDGREDENSEGYLILTFNPSGRGANMKAESFKKETNEDDEDDDEEGPDMPKDESDDNEQFYGEAFWVGAEGEADADLKPADATFITSDELASWETDLANAHPHLRPSNLLSGAASSTRGSLPIGTASTTHKGRGRPRGSGVAGVHQAYFSAAVQNQVNTTGGSGGGSSSVASAPAGRGSSTPSGGGGGGSGEKGNYGPIIGLTNPGKGKRMLKCERCAKYYRNQYSLRHHICLPRKDVWKKGDIRTQVIDGQLYYYCPTCDKSFKWLGNLTRHFYVHTGQRFFKCEVCNKEFFSAYQVKRHMNSHTGMRFKCEVCDKPFTCKYACAWHTRQHYTYVE